MTIQKTLVLIKPDGIQRGLIGEIIKRFEQRGIKIVAMKMVHVDKKFASKHYKQSIADKHGEHVRNYLLDYLTATPIVAIVLQGSNVILHVRKIVGNTYPGEADIGTIRGDFAHASKAYAKSAKKALPNLIHASENEEDAKEEIALWFSKDEIHNYKLSHEDHIY
ncbi:nucleoside-diphosphate kinase [Candidatus Pacearchaeota archaeon]|nr:nucleoside-diphosphate kinase [Candidatus Pacearchaeota archaeon]